MCQQQSAGESVVESVIKVARNKKGWECREQVERRLKAVMGGSPPTPGTSQSAPRRPPRAGPRPPAPRRVGPAPAMPPFLFPLPQCSYVSFPLYFLWLCVAAEISVCTPLTKIWDIAVSLPRRGARHVRAGGASSLTVTSLVDQYARLFHIPRSTD